jgi:hypothetical protein
MDKTTAVALLKSLLARLNADAGSERPVFGALVSQVERDALRLLLDEASPLRAPESQASGGLAEKHSEPAQPVRSAEAAALPVEIDWSALALTSSESPNYVVCLDFGTAKSKAFAASLDEDEPELKELALGKRDGDLEQSVYAVSSSVWIDDEGLMFAGAQAVRRGQLRAGRENVSRRRLDSLKQELSQIRSEDGGSQLLDKDLNPTGYALSYDDAITFYLAYLTDLVGSELEAQGLSRYTRRRFTLPWWRQEQREWASRYLATRLERAQILADTFRGRWAAGIPAPQFKEALASVVAKDAKLEWLIDGRASGSNPGASRWGALLEPLAAGSGRLWHDKATRDVVVVVDVGAGTTDFSLFFAVQQGDSRTAHPIAPGGTAIRMAGDTLDSNLIKELLERAHVGGDPALRARLAANLQLSGVRRLKEQLFVTGRLTQSLEDDRVVSLTRDEFLGTKGVKNFQESVAAKLQELLGSVDPSWAKAAPKGEITMVLTGGGADLPMIQALAKQGWTFAGRAVKVRLAKTLPPVVEQEFDETFAREYPQLAVAIGGALPQRLDEKKAIDRWLGGEATPGPIEKFRSKGI